LIKFWYNQKLYLFENSKGVNQYNLIYDLKLMEIFKLMMENNFTSEIISVKGNKNIFKFSNPIEIFSPKMRLMFPIEQRYGQIQMKLEFSKIKTNSKMTQFYRKIMEIQEYCSNKFFNYINKITTIKSQILQLKNYDPYLLVKIPMLNKKPFVKIHNINDSLLTIYEIPKNSYISTKLYVDLIWFKNNTVVIKWKTKNIYC